MAKRDVMRTADAVRGMIPTVYDMSAEDLYALRTISYEDLFDAFTVAFRFGFCMGGRAALKGKFKEKKAGKGACRRIKPERNLEAITRQGGIA